MIASLLRALEKGTEKFKQLGKRTHQNPTPDNIHDLRVQIRRLRARLWLISKKDRSRAIHKLRRSLRKISRTLGDVRQHDVAIEDARRFKVDTQEIVKRRTVLREKAQQSLKHKHRLHLIQLMNRAWKDVSQLDSKDLVPKLKRLERELEQALHRAPKTDSTRHQLRIRAKQARYTLDMVDCKIPSLERLQDHLGRWHDFVALESLIGHFENIAEAKDREWKKAVQFLKPALNKTQKELGKMISTTQTSLRNR